VDTKFVVDYSQEPALPPNTTIYTNLTPKKEKVVLDLNDFTLVRLEAGSGLNSTWRKSSFVFGNDQNIDLRTAEELVRNANSGRLKLGEEWERGIFCFGTVLKNCVHFQVPKILGKDGKYHLTFVYMDKTHNRGKWGYIHKTGKIA
jgi:hypothetical protein